jgi:hypothetical protein
MTYRPLRAQHLPRAAIDTRRAWRCRRWDSAAPLYVASAEWLERGFHRREDARQARSRA